MCINEIQISLNQYYNVWAGWADNEMDWKSAEWLGSESGDQWCNVYLDDGN